MYFEYITLTIYLIMLLGLGAYFSRYTKNLSDFIRGGAQGTWWIVGMSMFISGISAFTFTGNASAAYDAGPTLLIIYLANVISYAISGLFLAKWFRQTRALTIADVIRARFGVAMEQFSAYIGIIMAPIAGSIQLWALAGFASSTFGFPLKTTIVVIGIIVVFYSTTGGKWAVMATDFVQGLIMMVITVVIAVLALNEIGGLGAFFSYFSDPRFAEDFKFVKDPGQFPDNKFSWQWIIVIFFMQLYGQISLSSAGRFLVAKDGREAQKAAWLAMVLMAFGSLVWFLPPMVGRFLYEAEINGLDVKNPSNGSYAYVALQLLPKGLIGIMIAAMFAATMSSMDTALNGQVGIIVRNIIPRIREKMGKADLEPATEMWLCRVLTGVLGGIIIFYSLLWVYQKDIVLFDAYLAMGAIIGIPLGFPMLAGLWLKKMWKWSYFFIISACLIPSAYAFYDTNVNDIVWTIQERAMWVFIFGSVATAICVPLAKWNDAQFQEQEKIFFETMQKPIDFEKEIGGSFDGRQLMVMGNASLILGLLLGLIVLIPNTLPDRLLAAGISGTILVMGAILKHRGKATEKA
ncbi:MAG: SSS family solute:Na+ symporter [Candidatus Latescibacterota bacterium]|jgi:SSS family solute:Na+ symporter